MATGATSTGMIVATAEVEAEVASVEATKDAVVVEAEAMVATGNTVGTAEATMIAVTAVHPAVGDAVVAVDRSGPIEIVTTMKMIDTVMTGRIGAAILTTTAGAVAAMVVAAVALASGQTSAPRRQPRQQLQVRTCR